MTIEKRPNATADKNAPTQAPSQAPILTPGTGPKLPGPPGVPGTERFRLLAYVKQESMVRVDKRPDETVLTWPHLLRAEFVMAMLISVLLVITSVFITAPLEEMANPAVTPHVAKAPQRPDAALHRLAQAAQGLPKARPRATNSRSGVVIERLGMNTLGRNEHVLPH